MSAIKWEGIQQSQMRQAAVKAGLVPDYQLRPQRLALKCSTIYTDPVYLRMNRLMMEL